MRSPFLSPPGPLIGRRLFVTGGAAATLGCLVNQPSRAAADRTAPARSSVDSNGVWRWADGREVALFGVNYNIGSASAFRFAKATGIPFDTIIEQDFAHFRRLGFNGLRLCFWGDWENSTATGDLVDNEHLAVLDRLLAKAGALGFACLLSPIVTYDASWPDAMSAPRNGISHAFDKAVLGTDPRAIGAQLRYLRQLLGRTNPHTGRRYAEEPALVAVEPINEPTHHAKDRKGSIAYIDALAGAVREAGFTGPIFYNVTQDMGMAPAIEAAQIDGATFAWYPTGLQNGRAVAGNGLLLVDRYEQFADPALRARAKLVYEFDAADSMGSYFYPAMVRSFRQGGAQLAAMFAYDSLPIAASNSEFNDHFLNLVYTPGKALSALIAGVAMRELARGREWGSYPQSMRFGGFLVDDARDLAAFADRTRFFHTNDTDQIPPEPARLEHLAGVGASPLVDYDGTGAWFLDRIEPGTWRLEVYPDAALVANPFAFRGPSRTAVRIVARARRMKITLPDLGDTFAITPVDAGAPSRARSGAFTVRPGVYRLSARVSSLAVDPIFHAPPPEVLAPLLHHEPPASRAVGKPWPLVVDVLSSEPPRTVTLWLRGDRGLVPLPFQAGRRFRWAVTVPPEHMRPGPLEYYITVETSGAKLVHPSGEDSRPGDWDFPKSGGYRTVVLAPDAPFVLLDAERHRDEFVVPYGGYSASPAIGISADADGAVLRIDSAALSGSASADLPAQRAWNGPLDMEGRDTARFGHLRVEGLASGVAEVVIGVVLVERDGMAWGAAVPLNAKGDGAKIALETLVPVEAAMLPRDFPVGINPWMLRRPAGRGSSGDRLSLANLQAIQVTIGKRFLPATAQPGGIAMVRRISLVP